MIFLEASNLNQSKMKTQKLLICLLFTATVFSLSAQQYNYGDRETLGTLTNTIDEASGMAPSYKHSNSFWVHNDGGTNKIYLYNYSSNSITKTVTINGEENRDWEDMATFEYGGTSYIAIGATGYNSSDGKRRQIIIVEEPGGNSSTASVSKHKRFVLKNNPDDIKDIEAFAFAPIANKVIMLSKNGNKYTGKSLIYSFDLNMNNTQTVNLDLSEPTIKTDNMISRVTGMDISNDEKRIIIIGYERDNGDNDLNEYTINNGQSIKDALRFNTPRQIDLEANKTLQYESICYDNEGKDIYYTYETSNAKVYRFSVTNSTPPPTTPSNAFFEVENKTDWRSSGTLAERGGSEAKVGSIGLRGQSYSGGEEFRTSSSTIGKNTGVTHNNGKLKFWYDANDVVGSANENSIYVELRDSNGVDGSKEYQWNLTGLVDGWKEYSLDLNDLSRTGSVDLTDINYFRIYNGAGTFSRTTYLDDIRFESNVPAKIIIDDCEDFTSWSSGAAVLRNSSTSPSGLPNSSNSVKMEGNPVLEFKKEFASNPIDARTTLASGAIEIWYRSKTPINNVHFEISSSTGSNVDTTDLEWVRDITSTEFQKITLPFDNAQSSGSGNIDLSSLKSFRIFNATNGPNVNRQVYIDDIYIITSKTASKSVKKKTRAKLSGINIFPNPAKDFIQININKNTASSALFTVFDLSGRSLHQEEHNNASQENEFRIDVSTIKRGIYILEIKLDNERIVKRISIN